MFDYSFKLKFFEGMCLRMARGLPPLRRNFYVFSQVVIIGLIMAEIFLFANSVKFWIIETITIYLAKNTVYSLIRIEVTADQK